MSHVTPTGPTGSPAPVGSSRARPELPSRDEPTIGKLVGDATRDISTLVRSEIALAKSELKVSVKAGGLGIGLFAGAAFIGLRKVKQVKAPERAIHQAQETKSILKRG